MNISKTIGRIAICAALTAAAAFSQTKLTFEVATIRPAAPLDMAKLVATMRGGGKMPVGANIDADRALYTYLDLRTLISTAYAVKPYQITGPDWLATTRFDIVAKMPAGAVKADAPKMLQALLEERFGLKVHRASAEHPVLALVVGKGGPKLKESSETPVAIDENTPLKPGEVTTEGPDGPIRVAVDFKDGSSKVDMGLKGKVSYRMDPATQAMHLDGNMVTMQGFADMLTQFSQIGGGPGKQVVDMTGLKGYYQVSMEFALADLLSMARAAGMDIGPAGPGPGAGPSTASDPTGTASSMTAAVQALGLKLETRKAMVDQFVIDYIEKTPTDN